jgi:hypothetical protein
VPMICWGALRCAVPNADIAAPYGSRMIDPSQFCKSICPGPDTVKREAIRCIMPAAALALFDAFTAALVARAATSAN